MARKRPPTDDDPPAHLRAAGLALWRQVRADFQISDAAGRHLLAVACEASDRAADARAAIAQHGAVYLDRFGSPKANPAAAILRDAAAQQIMALRALGLTGSPED